MDLRALRLKLFQKVLGPFSDRRREQRMRLLAETVELRDGLSVLDLGGQPHIWASIPQRLDITIVNLDGIADTEHGTHHDVRYLVGDACELEGVDDRPYDLVFTNSVIEHVGDAERRRAFAAEVRKRGLPYWVQTPSIFFPLEPHCGMPLWWLYPRPLKRFFIERWRVTLPVWTEMVEGTTVVSKSELAELFPGSRIVTERLFGWPKSYIAMGVGSTTDSSAASEERDASASLPAAGA